MIKVTVWNEFSHEKEMENVREIYPDGIHEAIAAFLGRDEEIQVRTAYLEQPEHGLTDEVLADTDVIIWWGHACHHLVADEVADKVAERVLMGMGAIFLHSAHHSKPFKKLMGTSGNLTWREANEHERLWCVSPSHPITQGVPLHIEIPQEETYSEFFDITKPEDLLYIGWFSGGDVFRSGCTWSRGYGKMFYFQPGHETFPIYHMPEIQKIITNAVHWAYSPSKLDKLDCPHMPVSFEEELAKKKGSE